MKHCFLLLLLLISHAAFPAKFQLSGKYHANIDLQKYWISEKYDGVRAYWDGKNLVSRQGYIISAPKNFTAALTDVHLDGELWIERGQFDRLSGIVRRQSAVSADWVDIKYMVFDLPDSSEIFDHRLKSLEVLITDIDTPHIRLVKQFKISSHSQLMEWLSQVTENKGEGLMLHLGSSIYQNTRSNDLLKLKIKSDDEATVIGHLPGKGKFNGLLGSILVETTKGIQFKIGSGFSLAERKNPPPIGSIITFQYIGLTNKGTPRFASFLRIRNQH